jgi:hypothetical protein
LLATRVVNPHRVFLLSPASCAGARTRLLVREEADFDLAQRLRAGGASLGEVFSFLSGLYFRGKLAYAERFEAPPPGVPGILVITTSRGLLAPRARLTRETLEEFAAVPLDARDPRYREPLAGDAAALAARLAGTDEVVLLGSVATGKYLDPLVQAFGPRLRFPGAFVGRGDMSRGGLLLRCAAAGVELAYRGVDEGPRRGTRPARLSARRQP